MALAVYQLWMLLLDAAAFLILRKRPSPRRVFSVVVAGGLLALFGAIPIAMLHERTHSMFVTLGLWASAIFVHGPLVLFGCWYFLRESHRRASWVPLGCALILSVIGIDAFAIEPTSLEINRHRVESERIDEPLKVVVLADFQTDQIGAYERRVLAAVAKEAPDLVLLPGDYIHESDPARHEELRSELNAELRGLALRPKYGIHAVRGNTELNGWAEIFSGLDAETYLRQRTISRDGISITGLTLSESSFTSLRVDRQAGFHIVLGHNPNFALGDVQADLLIAGHTHGGQVRLPGIGPLITLSAVPRSWAAGRTELDDGRTLIVSRGTGMERVGAPRLRFLCRPELVVIELIPQSR